MSNRLLWKLFAIVAVGTVLLFWLLNTLSSHTEESMSFIDEQYQQQLVAYGKQAEQLYLQGDLAALNQWLLELQAKEQTWAAVTTYSLQTIGESQLDPDYLQYFRLGRDVGWKIHLYFKQNPVMDLPFSDGKTSLLIRLPQRMRPGAYAPHAWVLLQFGLPLVLLCLLSWVLYQHVMAPLRKLESATRQFSQGKLNVRTHSQLDPRNDELTSLARTFDHMADSISQLIVNQRQLLADLSHELRTPLARLDMAVEFVEQGLQPQEAIHRLRYESENMRQLVEDTLTLAWLDNEKPQLGKEQFDLVNLLEVICEDAAFEYSDRVIVRQFPAAALLHNSSQQALGSALENIIRNGLSHTPEHSQLTISVSVDDDAFLVAIADQGRGVPEPLLKDIFKPFFRTEEARQGVRSRGDSSSAKPRGFGLGLALSERQIEAVGGRVWAENIISKNHQIAGLVVFVRLPIHA